MKKFLALTAFVATATLAAVAPAMAGTQTGTVTVGASTAAFCTQPTTQTIALGNYDGRLPATGSSAVTFRCTTSTPATVTLLSASTGGTNAAGQLTDLATSTPINYTFTGDGATRTGTGLTTGNDISTSVGVTVAAGQNPAPGTYSDTINVTVTY
jgi:spore coat protein U-like protein